MRILQVIEFVTLAKGGSVQAARTTAAGLARRGHQVELWTSAYGQALPIDGVRLRMFRGPAVSGLYLTPGIVRPAFAELAGFDIVHFRSEERRVGKEWWCRCTVYC